MSSHTTDAAAVDDGSGVLDSEMLTGTSVITTVTPITDIDDTAVVSDSEATSAIGRKQELCDADTAMSVIIDCCREAVQNDCLARYGFTVLPFQEMPMFAMYEDDMIRIFVDLKTPYTISSVTASARAYFTKLFDRGEDGDDFEQKQAV